MVIIIIFHLTVVSDNKSVIRKKGVQGKDPNVEQLIVLKPQKVIYLWARAQKLPAIHQEAKWLVGWFNIAESVKR